MIYHAHKFVFDRDLPLLGPSHMVGDVQFSGERDGPPVLAAHHVEPLELDTEHLGRPLYLVLLGGGHLLVTLLALVHILTLPQVLSTEVARKSSVNVVRLSERTCHSTMILRICQET